MHSSGVCVVLGVRLRGLLSVRRGGEGVEKGWRSAPNMSSRVGLVN